MPGLGLTLLGISAALDNPDDPQTEGDCKVNAPKDNPEGLADGQMLLRMSPSHHGIETNPYTLMLMATDPNSGGSTGCSATTLSVDDDGLSVVLKTSSNIAPTADLSPNKFLAFAEGAVYDGTTRKITGPTAAVTGAAFYRYRVNNDKGDWFVYTTSYNTAITLPATPTGVDDRASAARLSVSAVSLTSGNTLDKLVSADGEHHLNNLISAMDGFSRINCLKKITSADPDYATKCTPADPTKVDPACNPACEVR